MSTNGTFKSMLNFQFSEVGESCNECWDIQNYSQISIPRSWSKLKIGRAFVYQWDIQIYAQFSIPRSWSNSKLDRAFSLDLGLNGEKIARNVTKVGVDACLPMGHPKLFSNFNSEKLVKV
jgi:hypothetical protein